MIDQLKDTDSKRRVAIYIRVSTAEQKIDGYGLEAQERRLTEYVNGNPALNLETKPEWLYKDTHTGSDLNRPELTRLLTDVKKGKYDAVLVWKIDRLSRSLKHLLHIFEGFEDQNVSFVSVQENIDFKGPIGKLIFQIFGAIAQFERELIKGRTQMGKIASAEAGNYTGTNVPYGYEKIPNPSGKGSTLRLITSEKKWVEQIYEWYIFDGLGEGQIAKELNERHVPKKNHRHTSRASVKWTNVMVRTILTNPLYRGMFVANKKDEAGSPLSEEDWTMVEFPSCVSELTFMQAQETRKRRVHSGPVTDYLLTGKLVDIDLDRPKKFVGAKRTKGGFSYRRKQFKKNGKHYPVFEIAGEPMEEYVWSKILQALKDPEVFIKQYLSQEYTDPTRLDRLQQELSALRSGQMNAELAISRIENAYEAGAYSQEKMASKVTEQNEAIGKIEQRIAEIEDEMRLMSTADIEVKKLRDAAKQVKYRLDNLDPRQKKILCNLFIDRIEMTRRKVHNRWKVTPHLYFRFNPKKFEDTVEVGRTSKTLGSAKRGNLKGKNSNHGGRSQT